jgi:hypothetical protein
MFHIGQQVMCIKDFPTSRRQGFNSPQVFHIYTVRAHCPCSPTPALLLAELHNRQVIFAITLRRGEASFTEKRFAPLDKLEDEIIVSTSLPLAKWREFNRQ